MSTIETTINAYLAIQARRKEQNKVLSLMKAEEKELTKIIQNYLIESDQKGIRLNDKILITLETKDKKILMTRKNYKDYVQQVLTENGIEDSETVDRVLDKTTEVVQEHKLKVVIEK